MAYVTLADLLTRDSERDLINITDPTGAAVDSAVVDQAIANAEGEVNSYIEGRVLRLPLAEGEVSQQIKNCALIIARYYLYADRKTDAVIAEYERMVSWLKDVARGLASTGIVQTPDDDDTAVGRMIFAPVAKPVFGPAFEALYDVPMGPNGSGSVGIR